MSIPTKNELLKEIHGEMRTKGITQQDLAEMLNLSKATINRHLSSADVASYDRLVIMHDAVVKSGPVERKVIVEYYQDGEFVAMRVERNNELASRSTGYENAETLIADESIKFENKREIRAGSTYKRVTIKFSGSQERPS